MSTYGELVSVRALPLTSARAAPPANPHTSAKYLSPACDFSLIPLSRRILQLPVARSKYFRVIPATNASRKHDVNFLIRYCSIQLHEVRSTRQHCVSIIIQRALEAPLAACGANWTHRASVSAVREDSRLQSLNSTAAVNHAQMS